MSALRWAAAGAAGALFITVSAVMVASWRSPRPPPIAPLPQAAEPTPGGPGRWLDGVVCLRLVGTGGTSRFSGFVADPSGLIITTAHGVVEGERYEAVFRGGRSTEAQLLARDAVLDLAVFEADAPAGTPSFELLDLAGIDEGAELWVLGCPVGGEWTLSRGIVASRAARVRAGPGPPLFHADANAFPGSSGGPLVDHEGRVLGVLKGTFESADGQVASLPLAIPAPFARAMVSRGWDARNSERSVSGFTAAEWLARGLAAQEDVQKADAYRTCIEANDYSAACRFNLALVAEREGEREVARSAYHELVQQRPDFVPAYQNLIALEVEDGRLDEAERVCDDALVMLAAPAEIANNCGLVARQRGEAERALERFDLAIRTEPDYVTAALNRAVLLDEDLGRCGEALADYRVFVAATPDGPERRDAERAIARCTEPAS